MASASCDSRCTSSKGGACDCACGGTNHGGETRGQNEYWLDDDWTARRDGSKWVGVHKDGLVTPPVRTLTNLRTMHEDGRLDKYHDGKSAKDQAKRASATQSAKEFGESLVGQDLSRGDLQGIIEAKFTDMKSQELALAAYDAKSAESPRKQTRKEFFQESNAKIAEMAAEARKDAAKLSDEDLKKSVDIVKNQTTDVAMAYKDELRRRQVNESMRDSSERESRPKKEAKTFTVRVSHPQMNSFSKSFKTKKQAEKYADSYLSHRDSRYNAYVEEPMMTDDEFDRLQGS